MAADRQIMLGTIIAVDHDANGTYTTIENTVTLTPPPREREVSDKTVLGDTLATEAMGIEAQNDFVFMHFWDPTDSNHTMLDTLFADKTEVNWRVTYPHATPITSTFAGVLKGMTHPDHSRGDMLSRTCTVSRRGAITNA